MAKQFEQHIVSKRFMEVFDELVERGSVASMKEFCQRVEHLPQSLSYIRTGKRDISIDLLIKIFEEFKGNPIYILFGQGPKVADDKQLYLPKFKGEVGELKNDNRVIEKLEQLVDAKNEFIQSLKSENARLSEELKRLRP
ncbi:MAG TPA: hypothetical protein VIN08_03715 [Ohtaekwangia sp.]|uniref:hypothetical protein n=1 Tax=Ohtaekwangia sp. TaxID=2066019 RepID=UPI002F9209D5